MRIETLAVHAGRHVDPATGALTPPILEMACSSPSSRISPRIPTSPLDPLVLNYSQLNLAQAPAIARGYDASRSMVAATQRRDLRVIAAQPNHGGDARRKSEEEQALPASQQNAAHRPPRAARYGRAGSLNLL